MSSVIGLKCKSCNADLKYNPSVGMWVCEYCGNKYEKEEFEENKKVVSKEETPKDLTEYACSNCGAILIADKNTTATECVYCGSSAIIKNRLQGRFKPDKIIPFSTSKGQAVQRFEEFVNERWFVPNEFSNKDNIKKVSGIYIPFWLFDCKADGKIRFDAQKIYTYTSGNYSITETKYYDCYRAGEGEYIDIPADGSTKFPDDIMDSIEPYNYSEFKEFNYSYLSGFLAEKFDLNSEQVYARAKLRAENTLIDKLFVGFEKYDVKKL